MKQSKNKPRIARRLEPPGNVVNHRLKLQLGSLYLPVWDSSPRHEPVHHSVRFPGVGMAFNPFPFDLMLPQCSIKTLPEIDIFYWFFVCGFPATFFPVMDPLGDTLADILAVGTQNDFAMFF